jgi:hypothetical protein
MILYSFRRRKNYSIVFELGQWYNHVLFVKPEDAGWSELLQGSLLLSRNSVRISSDEDQNSVYILGLTPSISRAIQMVFGPENVQPCNRNLAL